MDAAGFPAKPCVFQHTCHLSVSDCGGETIENVTRVIPMGFTDIRVSHPVIEVSVHSIRASRNTVTDFSVFNVSHDHVVLQSFR